MKERELFAAIAKARANLLRDVEYLIGEDHAEIATVLASIKEEFVPLFAPFCEVTYTDAPTDYDGFGTETVEVLDIKTRRGMVRKVQTPKEHVGWQRGRYGSGMYYSLDEAGFVANRSVMT